MSNKTAKKFRTFEQAFEAVLDMSPEEILDAPDDPFLENAFNVFEYYEENTENLVSFQFSTNITSSTINDTEGLYNKDNFFITIPSNQHSALFAISLSNEDEDIKCLQAV